MLGTSVVHIVSRRLCTKPVQGRTHTFLLKSTVVELLRKQFPLQIIVGAKGVGKSFLLRSIYEETHTNASIGKSFYSAAPVLISSEKIQQFMTWYKTKEKVTLFLDNLQNLPCSSTGVDYQALRIILKEISRGFNDKNWKVLAAVSRHGLKKLVEENFLPVDEAKRFMVVLSPDEKASEHLFAEIIGERNIHVPDPIKKFILHHFGHHALHVSNFLNLLIQMANDNNVDQALLDAALVEYSAEVQGTLNHVLKKDEKGFSANVEDAAIYRRTIALLASGLSLPHKDLVTSPIFLPWTMLKEGSNGEIQVVSQFVKDRCQKFLTGQSPSTLLEMIRDTCAMPTRNETVVGNLFELLFITQLEVTKEIEFFALGEDNKFHQHTLKVPQLKIQTVKKQYFPEPKEELSSGIPLGCYGHNTAGFDIVLYIGDESHALQLTISQLGQKIPRMSGKKVWKEQTFDYQYIATPHPVDKDVLGTLLKNENVNKEFNRRKLRVIVPDSLFGEELQSLRSYLSINTR